MNMHIARWAADRLHSILWRHMVRAGLVAQCADAPDTAGVNAAAVQSAELGREQLAYFKQLVADSQPQRDQTQANNNAIAQAQLKGMDFATSEAQRLAERNQTVFQPLEDKIVSDAQTYDTPERRAAMSAQATAGVESAFDNAQASNNRALLRMGVMPGGAAQQSLMQDASLAKAKAVAGATQAAGQQVEQQGYARMQDAAALGKGLIGNQATQQQIATSTGGAAVGSGGAALGAATSGAGLMQSGFAGAMQGQGQAGSLYGQAANIESQSSNNTMNGLIGIGTLAGKFMSDEGVKKDTDKPADGAKALAEIEATPVKEGWQYDESKGAPAGSGGVDHIGPMAQDVRAKMGDAVAPDGKAIDIVNMNGKIMASVQHLAKEVKALKNQQRTRARMSA